MEGNTDGRASASAWTARRGRRPQHVCKLLAWEPGDLVTGQDQEELARIGKVMGRKPMVYGDEKSDPFIVAGKPANGDGRPEPERVERRGGAEENTGQTSTRRTRAWQACPLDWTVYGQLQG